jgi:hypothetical protein
MKLGWSRFLVLGALCLSSAGLALAGTAHGTVVNRTTGKPAANVDVVLVSPQAGMQELASTKSDTQGQFTFDNPAIGAQPLLIRASYRGVNFNSALPPGRSEAQVEVFEVSKDTKNIAVDSHVVVFQPNGSTLMVGEEYTVQNASQPPQAYFRAAGSFEFAIPAKAQLQQVATTGSTGMPVTQAQIDRGNDHYAIAYAFRPGPTNVRLSYELPYAENSATLKLPAIYPGARLLVVAPPGVKLIADGLQAAGQEQGMDVYTHQPLAAKSALAINISGAGAPAAAVAGGQSSQEMPQGNSRTESANIQAVPGRLEVLKWPLIVGFAALFALGAILLTRKPVAALVPAVAGGADPAQHEHATLAASPSVRPVAPTLAAVDAEIGASLDALKDALFKLELRRQAGTIPDEEYARERARMEKLLRDLVRG